MGSSDNFLPEIETLEFYTDKKNILHVMYNARDFKFNHFWRDVCNANEICKVIFTELKYQFPGFFTLSNSLSCSWKETFLKVINSYCKNNHNNLDIFMIKNRDIYFNIYNRV